MGKKYTKEQEKEVKCLTSNYEMLEKSKEEAKLRGAENSVSRIELAQKDVVEQLKKIDPDLVETLKVSKTEEDDELIFHEDGGNIDDLIDSVNNLAENKPLDVEELNKEFGVKENFEFNNVDMEVQYDIVELPSKGQCYKEKFARVPVGYLTAYDENFITSPNLYKDGLIIDYLLKHKVMNRNIKIEELCAGDVDAITLFLRVTSYGPEYPIIVRDPETGEEIETTIDLSQLKLKEFTLNGDENGYFDFELPVSKDKVKFKFLTRKDKRILEKLGEVEDYGIKSHKIKQMMNSLTSMLRKDDVISGKDKQIYMDNIKKLSEWCEKLNKKSNTAYNKTITNRLEVSVISINGETDRSYISKYIKNMPARDALMLRKYMSEHEPGVDFSINVNRPESLGGGSFKTFLEWEDTIFLNLT